MQSGAAFFDLNGVLVLANSYFKHRFKAQNLKELLSEIDLKDLPAEPSPGIREIQTGHGWFRIAVKNRQDGLIISISDISGFKSYEKELLNNQKRHQAYLSATPDYMFRIHRDGTYLDIHANAIEDLFIPGTNALGHKLDEFLPPAVANLEMRNIDRALASRKIQVYEYELLVHNQKRIYESRLIATGPDEVVAIVRDVTSRKRLENQLLHQALHDAFTGLPNRRLFLERLDHAITRKKRNKSFDFAVLYLDLDRFKLVNDNFGHSFGDSFLKAVASKLKSCVREHDIIARLAGDEFAILIEDLASVEDCHAVVARIEHALSEPVVIEDKEVQASVSTGIAVCDDVSQTANDLLASADFAMYMAKKRGKSRSVLFSAQQLGDMKSSIQIQRDLGDALRENQFTLHYQPIIETASMKIRGFEALIRWKHPQFGFIPPDKFIPYAEENDLIVSIGEWVVNQACAQLAEWHPVDSDLFISLNVSPRQMLDQNFALKIRDALFSAEIEGSKLKLEITETLFMEYETLNQKIIDDLLDLGVHLSIDDFGTGYSSFLYLKRFPVDFLKIDRAFISNLHMSEEDQILTKAMLGLSRNLGIQTIAEGIEEKSHLAFLKKEKCDFLQGFYFSKPVDSTAALQLLKSGF